MSLSAMRSSKFLLAEVAMWVRKVAIEREHGVLHQRVQPVMHALDRIAARRDMPECLFELREAIGLDHQVKLAQPGRAEPELAAREAPAFDQTFGCEVAEVFLRGLDQRDVAHTRLEIAPDVIEVHVVRARP